MTLRCWRNQQWRPKGNKSCIRRSGGPRAPERVGEDDEMVEQPGLSGILETALYCDSSNEDATRDFYVEVMGLTAMAFDFGYRVGSEGHVFLLFNRDNTVDQEKPPPHGATGKGHCCFTAVDGTYEEWKSYLEERDVAWGGEITWGNGMRSFYFEDSAGNVLEIAEGDFWPGAVER